MYPSAMAHRFLPIGSISLPSSRPTCRWLQGKCRYECLFCETSSQDWRSTRKTRGPSVHGQTTCLKTLSNNRPNAGEIPHLIKAHELHQACLRRELRRGCERRGRGCAHEAGDASNWRRDRIDGHIDVSGDRGFRSRVPETFRTQRQNVVKPVDDPPTGRVRRRMQRHIGGRTAEAAVGLDSGTRWFISSTGDL